VLVHQVRVEATTGAARAAFTRCESFATLPGSLELGPMLSVKLSLVVHGGDTDGEIVGEARFNADCPHPAIVAEGLFDGP
jgi:hypothetical protein